MQIKFFHISAFLVLIFSFTLLVKAEGRSPASGHSTSNSAEIVLDLTDFGAIGDGVTDDGPALQEALRALALSGGGTLAVPAGRYLIATPVSNESSTSNLTIRGVAPAPGDDLGSAGQTLGLTSIFIIGVGESHQAFSFQKTNNLRLQNLKFLGREEVMTDALVTLSLSGVAHARIIACEFYGLASYVGGGAVLWADDTDLSIEKSAFLGCGAQSAIQGVIVQNQRWRGLSVSDTRFIDYGNGEFFSKTTRQSPYAWINMENAAALDTPATTRSVILRNVTLDEGALYAFSCLPDFYNGGEPLTPIALVYATGLNVNVSNLGAYGLFISSVKQVIIEQSHFGWSHNTNGAIYLQGIDDAMLDQIECTESADKLTANYTVKQLTVSQSTYTTLDSTAQSTHIIDTENLIDSPTHFVRQHYLDFLNREPEAGGLAYWSQQLTFCGNDAECLRERRTAVSAAFFIESEFQETGSFVYRLYKGALGRRPLYAEFMADRGRVIDGAELEASKQAYAEVFVERDDFIAAYGETSGRDEFVDALTQTVRVASGIDLSARRTELLDEYDAYAADGQTAQRARVLRKLIEFSEFKTAEFNPAFVLMQYFGYLRRDPDEGGYQFWLSVVNNPDISNYHSMVEAFLTSPEYLARFAVAPTEQQ